MQVIGAHSQHPHLACAFKFACAVYCVLVGKFKLEQADSGRKAVSPCAPLLHQLACAGSPLFLRSQL
jgi:hypothetical protein